jgi:hypothetical protein
MKKIYYPAITLLLCFLYILPLSSASESSNYKLINGQANPISGKSSNSSNNLQGGGSSIAGQASSDSFGSTQGTVFSYEKPEPATSDDSENEEGSGGGSFSTASNNDNFETELNNLSVTNITTNSARISFETEAPTRVKLKFGSNKSLSSSTNYGGGLVNDHTINLINLKPSSEYLFKIIVENSQNQIYKSEAYSFTTLPDISTIPTVSNFSADYLEEVILTWNNPDFKKFGKVKIVRSKTSYPNSPSDGTVVFSGEGEYYLDKGLNLGITYYYTAFVMSESGDYSPGVIDSITVPEEDNVQEKDKNKDTQKPGDDKTKQDKQSEADQKQEVTPEKSDIVEEIEDEIPQEELKATSSEKIEEKIEGKLEEEKQKQEDKKQKEDLEIKIDDETEDYEITMPADPPELPDIATPIQNKEKSKAEEEMSLFTIIEQKVSGGIGQAKEQAQRISSSTRKEINKIRDGLITQSNQIKDSVYNQLSQQKKEQVDQKLVDNKPPTSSPNTIAKITPHSIKAQKEGADWHIFSDSKALFSIPSSTFDKPVKSITVTVEDRGYILNYNKKSNQYEAVIDAPEEKGKYEFLVQIIYADNTYERLNETVLVDPYGKVYTEKFKDFSWSKPWQIFEKKKVAVKDAKVTLYYKNPNDKWVRWPAHLYNQNNPQLSSRDGDFSFIAPEGKYYLAVSAANYENKKTNPFEIKDKIVNKNIELNPKYSWKYWLKLITFGTIIVTILSYLVYLLIKRN